MQQEASAAVNFFPLSLGEIPGHVRRHVTAPLPPGTPPEASTLGVELSILETKQMQCLLFNVAYDISELSQNFECITATRRQLEAATTRTRNRHNQARDLDVLATSSSIFRRCQSCQSGRLNLRNEPRGCRFNCLFWLLAVSATMRLCQVTFICTLLRSIRDHNPRFFHSK